MEVMRRLMTVEALVGLVATVIFLLFPNRLILLFGAANESVYYTQFAIWFIRSQLCLLPLACVNKGTVIFLQSLGKAKESAVLSLTREIVFGVGLPVLLPMIWGLYALPCFMPVADTLTFLAVAFILYKVKKELEAAISMSDSDGIEQAHQ